MMASKVPCMALSNSAAVCWMWLGGQARRMYDTLGRARQERRRVALHLRVSNLVEGAQCDLQLVQSGLEHLLAVVWRADGAHQQGEAAPRGGDVGLEGRQGRVCICWDVQKGL